MSIMTVKDLKKKAPKGEFLAYINKEEAAALKRAGGSGHLVNGIPSFVGSDYSGKGDANTSGYQGGMRGNSGYQGGSINSETNSGDSGNFTNPQAATDKLNRDIKERAEKRARHDYGPKKNVFEKMAAYNKRYKNAWASKQKQKQLAAIDKMIAKNYTANPHMDIAEIRDALMSQYDGTTNTMTGLEGFNTGKPGMNFGKTQLGPLGLKTTGVTGKPLGTKYMDTTPSLYSHPSNTPSIMGQILGKVSPPNINNLMSSFNRINQLSNIQKNGVTQAEITDYYDRAQGKGKYGDSVYGDGDVQQPLIPFDYNTGAATTEAVEPYTNNFDYRFGNDQDVIFDDYGTSGYRTTAAEGGIMGTRARRAMGGIMERVDKRQGYFLGKLVKKVGNAAKKVLSSDIGKMAIAGAAFYYGGGGSGMFAKGASNQGGFMGGLKAMGGNFFSKANPLLFKADKTLSLGKLGLVSAALPFLAGGAKPNETSFSDRGGQLIDPLTGEPNDMAGMRENIELAKLEAGDDADKLAAIDAKYNNMLNLQYQAGLPDATPYNLYGSRGYRTTRAATGGRIGRAEGGLMDLGGMEKDYRAEGGFVPIGEYEKKDDVPARLSVNEFVFTADAVRGAGQGDIDKGAEIMENMMENLENGGTISKESQGNKGAQNMFKTSERLGAVI